MGFNLTQIVSTVQRTLRDNSPAILTALGVSGTISTAYLTGKATWEASKKLHSEDSDPWASNREKFEEVWELYIPPVIAGTLTIGCIIGANHISSKRVAAAYSVAAVIEKGYEEYREKVVEQLGENKEKKVRDELAQDRVNEHPTPAVIVGSGDVMCFEEFTGRYFKCDMHTLLKAENEINSLLNREMYATLTDFYYKIGLSPTSTSSGIGWKSDRLLSLLHSTTTTDQDVPCLSFDYNYITPI